MMYQNKPWKNGRRQFCYDYYDPDTYEEDDDIEYDPDEVEFKFLDN